jgi:hypothetical protein
MPDEPQLNEDGEGNKDFHSNLRCPDGGGGARVTSECMQGDPTPGSTNEPTCSGGPPVPVEMSLCEAMQLDDEGYPVNIGVLVHITSPVLILNNDGTYGVGRLDHGFTDGECCGYLFDFDGYMVLNEGDEIDLTGTVDFYNGKTEISGPDLAIVVLSTGNPLPEPELITTEELALNGNDYESCLIMIDNLTIISGTWPPEGENANLGVVDETMVEVTLRIDADTDIDGSDPPGEPFTCVGIGGQFDTGAPWDEYFQILPRKRTDIWDDPLIRVCCLGCDCFLMTREECLAAGGEWHEEWDDCDPNPCTGSPVEGTSWGAIKNIYR